MSIWRIPGPLDPHVHLRGLQWARKGTMTSETRAALAGGFTAVLDMPNAEPTTTSPAGLQAKRQALERGAVCDWGCYYGVHPVGNRDTFPCAMAHTVGLKIYCGQTTGDLFVAGARREEHFAAWRDHGLIAVHAEDAEVDAVLTLVERYRIHTHFCHISTQAELDSLRRAKDRGLPVSVGVCPHHLWLTAADEYRLGPFALMKPPLKSQRDVDYLWQGLRTGWVDVLESDHAPHTLQEKRTMPAAFGVPGLETLLPLMGTAVAEGRLERDRLEALTVTAPRRIFGIPCPPDTWTELEFGAWAPLRGAAMQALCGWTPFEGQPVCCRVVAVQLRGQPAYNGQDVLVPPGYGEPVQQMSRSRP